MCMSSVRFCNRRSSKAFENPSPNIKHSLDRISQVSCLHHHLPLKCLMLSSNLAIRVVPRPMSNLMVGQHVVEHWQLRLPCNQPWLLSWHRPLCRLHATLELPGGPDARRKAGGKRGGRRGSRGGHAADVGVTFKLVIFGGDFHGKFGKKKLHDAVSKLNLIQVKPIRGMMTMMTQVLRIRGKQVLSHRSFWGSGFVPWEC